MAASGLIARPASLVAALAIVLSAPVVRAQSAADSAAVAPTDSVRVPQRDVGDLARAILHRPVPTDVVQELRPGLSLTVLPSVGYNAAYGAYVGASVSLGGWLGDPKTTSLSSGAAGATYSTEGQISVQFRSDFYLSNDQWALKLDWRYLDTSQPTFGLGPALPDRSEYPMDFVLYRSYQTLYRRVSTSPIFFGIGYHFDRYDQIRDERAEQGETTPYVAYSGGAPTRAQLSAVSANVLVDTRDRAIDARRGMFWNASLRSYTKGLGSDENSQSLWSDFRSFKPLPWKSHPNVLAIWSYLWFTFGHTPYLDLPAIGWDTYGRSGRGYVQGELRGTNQVYVEGEYRIRFTQDGLWGGVVFGNVSGTTSVPGGTFERLDPGGGAGLRMKFNKRTSTNLAADVAVGRGGTSRIFLGLQETF